MLTFYVLQRFTLLVYKIRVIAGNTHSKACTTKRDKQAVKKQVHPFLFALESKPNETKRK